MIKKEELIYDFLDSIRNRYKTDSHSVKLTQFEEGYIEGALSVIEALESFKECLNQLEIVPVSEETKE